MNQPKVIQAPTEFIKNQMRYLLYNFRSAEDISISIGAADDFFNSTNFSEFFIPDFTWQPLTEYKLDERIKKYIKANKANILSLKILGTEEASLYKNYATIYLIHPEMVVELRYIQEFKNEGRSLFREFTFASGFVKKSFPFVEISSAWEDGTKNLELSFREALQNIDEFIEKRCTTQ